MNTQLQQTIAEYFNVPAEEIKQSTVADDIPGWDSFSHMDLMSTIEKKMGTSFPFDAIMEFENVGDIERFITKNE